MKKQLQQLQQQVLELSPQLASSQAAVAQQQHHIDRLVKELSAAEGREAGAKERLEVVQNLNVQLQCEMMQMMAACEGEGTQGEKVRKGLTGSWGGGGSVGVDVAHAMEWYQWWFRICLRVLKHRGDREGGGAWRTRMRGCTRKERWTRRKEEPMMQGCLRLRRGGGRKQETDSEQLKWVGLGVCVCVWSRLVEVGGAGAAGAWGSDV